MGKLSSQFRREREHLKSGNPLPEKAKATWQQRALHWGAAFLAVMILLTLYTQVLLPSLLPQVSTGSAAAGTLKIRLNFTGTVEPVKEQYMTVEANLRVEELLAMEGDTLSEGAPLFRYDKADLEQRISEARTVNDNLNRQLRQAELNLESQTGESGERRSTDAIIAAWTQTARRLALYEQARKNHQLILEKYYGVYLDQETVSIDREPVFLFPPALHEDAEVTQARQEFEGARQALTDAKNALDDAQQAWEQAHEEASESRTASGRAWEGARLELLSVQQAIASSRTELARLSALKEAGGVINMPANGTLLRLNLAAGERTSDAPAIWYCRVEDGFRLRVPASPDELKEFGADATVSVAVQQSGETKSYSAQPVTAILRTAAVPCFLVELPDKEGYLPGDTAEVGLQKQSATQYKSCIPFSALHRDVSGYFVLTLERSDSIWGRSYTATRTSVALLELDAESAAVSLGDPLLQIVLSSDKPLEPGDRVRKAAS